MPGQCLIYDMYDNMLERVLPFNINKLGNKNSQQQSTEYFEVKDLQGGPKDPKTPLLTYN